MSLPMAQDSIGVPNAAIEPRRAERRAMLQGAAGLVLAWLTPHAAAAQQPTARPAAGDWLVRVGDKDQAPIAAADIPANGNPVMAWAMSPETTVVKSGSRLNRILLVRLDAAALVGATRDRSVDGVVAYSAICTHTGCEVGTYLADEQQLYCECHQSKFDPRDQARVTDGPAPRNLPALPLRAVDGRLVVAAPFTTRPGFEQG
jgi:Rieske Fe-S protein